MGRTARCTDDEPIVAPGQHPGATTSNNNLTHLQSIGFGRNDEQDPFAVPSALMGLFKYKLKPTA